MAFRPALLPLCDCDSVPEGAIPLAFLCTHLNSLWVELKSSQCLYIWVLTGPLPSSLARVATMQKQSRHLPLQCCVVGGAPWSPVNAGVCCRGPGGQSLCWRLCAHHPGLFADCSQPLDVVLLLDGSSSFPASDFDKMKSFAKAFISKANIGE